MNPLKRFTLIGIIFVLVTGSLAHFVYDWSLQNFIIGFFFPVSESTWEHMKLVFFPMLLYGLFLYSKLKEDYPCLASALPAGILSGTFLIPVLFYTYSGILGKNYMALDITTFVIAVLVAFIRTYRLTLSCRGNTFLIPLWTAVIITFACFLLFTYLPPDLGLFTSPVRSQASIRQDQ